MGFVKHGVHQQLEDVANELIRQSLVGVTSMEAKRDILTPWKQKDRLDREVYSPTGTPEASVYSGMYHRAWNSEQTHLNSRDGLVRGRRIASLSDHVTEHGSGSFSGDDE